MTKQNVFARDLSRLLRRTEVIDERENFLRVFTVDANRSQIVLGQREKHRQVDLKATRGQFKHLQWLS